MKKEFLDRVLKEKTVDTRHYRYDCIELADRTIIQRLPIEQLGTTAALDNWETVYTIR